MTTQGNSAQTQPSSKADHTLEKMALLEQFTHELDQKEFDIPPCPDTALRVRRAVDCDHATANKLADIINTEPLLVARIIAAANTALTRGRAGDISNIGTAISRIGMTMVRNIALAMATEKAFKAPAESHLKTLVQHYRTESVVTSLFCLQLARMAKQKGAAPDEAMLVGLMHSIGKFYLIAQNERFPVLFQNAAETNQLVEDWHAGISVSILEFWQLSRETINAVDHYSTPVKNPRKPDDASILRIATQLTNDFLDHRPCWKEYQQNQELTALGIDEEKFERVIEEISELAPSMLAAMGC